MYRLRLFATRKARAYEALYNLVERLVYAFDPVWRAIGYDRLERPAAVLETWTKGVLFDCQMCGRCILSSTGMSCPMNCPKSLRNGPCGGVRPDGHCEVEPEMRCVWVEAWAGSQKMRLGTKIMEVQEPVDHSLKGSSYWMRLIRKRATERAAGRATESVTHDSASG
ncbi:MAG: methylenetetrahydrofolate reductase C-terminal domain-containing protein [Acidiferrobacterales bacterium]